MIICAWGKSSLLVSYFLALIRGQSGPTFRPRILSGRPLGIYAPLGLLVPSRDNLRPTEGYGLFKHERAPQGKATISSRRIGSDIVALFSAR